VFPLQQMENMIPCKRYRYPPNHFFLPLFLGRSSAVTRNAHFKPTVFLNYTFQLKNMKLKSFETSTFLLKITLTVDFACHYLQEQMEVIPRHCQNL